MQSLRPIGFLVVVAVGAAAPARAWAAPSPVPSVSALTTGNGFGFSVFDLNQKKITEFLERPYRYLRPGATQQSLGVERRNLAYDVYFGLRAGSTGQWLENVPQTAAGYVAQSHIIRTVGSIGGVQGESYYFAPFGFSGNALIALLHVTNTSGAPVAVDVFLNPNFHLGSGTGDTVGADGETIATSGGYSTETGPGGGMMVYQPFGFDKADCSGTGYTNVTQGQDLAGTPTSCTNQTDITIDFQKSLGTLAAGADAWWGAAISFAPDGNGGAAATAMTTWLAGRAPAQLLADAEAELEAWRKPPPAGLSAGETAVWRQAETVLRMSQVREPYSDTPKQKGHGMLLASLPPGQWHIGWVRDAQYSIVALARMGHFQEARDALAFYLDAEANQYQSYTNAAYRISITRYFGDGVEESDWNSDGPNIELDGWGLYLWAARSYVDLSGDLAWLSSTTHAGENVYGVLRDLVAAPLDHNREAGGLIGKDTSIWESHWNNRKHYAYTSLAAARGLCDFASLAARTGDAASYTVYTQSSQAIRAGVHASLLDGTQTLAGSLEGLAAGKYHDGATLEAINWELFPSTDALVGGTLDGMSRLQVGSGGYMRNDDALSSYDSDEWVMIDLRASAAMRRAGRASAADALVSWVTSQAGVNQQLLPELYNQTSTTLPTDAYSGAIPMVGFGAAAYVLALADRAGLAPLSTDCGQLQPADDFGTAPDDASAPTDGGVSARDGAVAGGPADLAGKHPEGLGSGGGCALAGAAASGGAASGAAILFAILFAIWLALSRRRACASRDRGRAAG